MSEKCQEETFADAIASVLDQAQDTSLLVAGRALNERYAATSHVVVAASYFPAPPVIL
jgi:hypothetical protein